jgi:hypothetical protein
MTSSALRGDVPVGVADVLAPELPALSDAIIQTIGEEVPEYVRPLSGEFGRGVRAGVTQALERFLGLVRGPEQPDPELSRVYVALGRQEFRAGRTLDSLQAAYRIGAKVAWRRIAEVAIDAGFGPNTLATLAEAIFAYIDELSAESVEGYARAQSEVAGEHERRRRELIEALLRPGTPGHELAALAEEAGWKLPPTAAAVACLADDAPRLARRLGADIVQARIEGLGCVVLPDADAPSRRHGLEVATGDRPAAIGPNGPLSRLHESWRLARATLEAVASSGAVSEGAVSADDHLGDLLLVDAAHVVDRISESRLAGLANLTPVARERTIRTALAYLQHQGNAPAMARALHVHPQTARYRITRIREALGDQLDVPDARFELEAALRQALWTLPS